jgi:hypothetical protein
LPGGYAIFIASSSEIMLVDTTGAAGPHLQKVGNDGPVILGLLQALKGSKPGYFLIDSRTGTLQDGLSKADWLIALHAAGIPEEPALGAAERKRPRYRPLSPHANRP